MKNIVIPSYPTPMYNPYHECRSLTDGCGATFEVEDSDLYFYFGSVVVDCPNCKREIVIYTHHPRVVFDKYVREVRWKNSFLYKFFSFMTRPFKKDNGENQ